ncbi:hypothetical protein DINM_001631 [Dirofilaria immitis]|nr:hypothetical protein [Dirofilaria immitis]
MCLCLSKTANRLGHPRVSPSPVSSLRSPNVPSIPSTETSTKSGTVSTLTQQFEMNTSKQSIDESISSHSINGNKWSPKGGPKPKELPQLMPTAEFKTTPTGAIYRKIDYEVIDDRKFGSEPQDSSSLQHGFERKQDESYMDTSSSETKLISPIHQTEEITVYEYDSQKISRRTGEKPIEHTLHEKFVQDSMPHRRQWTEETKTEVWSSSTSKGAWQYDTKHFPPAPITPPKLSTGGMIRESWSSTEMRHHDIPAQSHDIVIYDEKPTTNITDSVPSSTIMIKRDQDGKLHTSETWDTKRQSASYSIPSTLEKHQRENIHQHSPVWAIVKSTRHDEDKKKEEEEEKQRKSDEKHVLSTYDDTYTYRTIWDGTKR